MTEGRTAETLSPALPEEVEAAALGLLEAARDRDVTLATAESCTGGLLASLLTDIEGCSHAFERGFVVYTDDAKAELLGVPRALLERDGAVSKSVAVAMAEGAITASKADIGAAITGYAGPAGDGAESGLVHFACARTGKSTTHAEKHFGDIGRGAIRIACMRTALKMMRDML